MANDPNRCAELAESLAEVATGAASGPDRARVLDHLSECDDCRAELERLSRVADEVLLLAPSHEPPAGFESAVLERIAGSDDAGPEGTGPDDGSGAGSDDGHAGGEPADGTRRHWVRGLVLAAAAAVIGLAGAGIVWQTTSDERELAEGYRKTLDIADGQYFSAAPVRDASGEQVGHVFLYQGEPSWVFAVLGDAPAPGVYDVRVATDDWTGDVASCDVEAKTGGAGGTINADIYQVREVRLVAPDTPPLIATLPDRSGE
ncbi:hypothetical protein CLV30_101249 [Haloactinopolyspora alba]|uniref:Uncharacterized protein n=1 Tax=Haloactinopolyspora alba TaxID=648780 RepID=A0A2P8EFN6_9ACTN|nr:hypothetical protein [Haloactinopolyspora alba]PSL08278.1 hypothetical protein CLV30_101249 [Haloactinopolyspora alba]